MKNLVLPLVAGSALLASGTANAQSFTYEVTWEPVEPVGGLSGPDGPRYRGGDVKGTFQTTYADGTTDGGDVRCVGMGQPQGGVFAIHLTCSFSTPQGAGTSVYGCNFIGQPGPETPLSCVGGLEGTSGPFGGRVGGLTMEWYSETQSSGTGQWYRTVPGG